MITSLNFCATTSEIIMVSNVYYNLRQAGLCHSLCISVGNTFYTGKLMKNDRDGTKIMTGNKNSSQVCSLVESEEENVSNTTRMFQKKMDKICLKNVKIWEEWEKKDNINIYYSGNITATFSGKWQTFFYFIQSLGETISGGKQLQ